MNTISPMQTTGNQAQYSPRLGRQHSGQLNTASKIVLYLILATNALQFSYWGMQEDTYGKLRIITIGLVVVLFLFTVKLTQLQQAFKRIGLLRLWLYCVLLFGIGAVGVYAAGAELTFRSLRDVAITLSIVLIGYHQDINTKFFARYVPIYIILGTVSSLSYGLTFGFEISSQYLIQTKNQIAPLFSILALLAIFHAVSFRKTRLLMIVCASMLIIAIGILRARTSLIALAFCLVLYLFQSGKLPLWSKVIIGILIVAFASINIDLISSIFLAGKEATDINSVSSGRVSRIFDGLNFLSRDNNFMTGSLWGEKYAGEIVHVFLMNLWINYGILSLPIVVLYFALLGVTIKHLIQRRRRREQSFEIAPLLILFLFIVSTNEYSYPFSPISSLFLAYLIYGAYLKNRSSLSLR